MHNTITIVTGSASGIGRHVAIQAAQRGSQVIATDVNRKGLVETESLAKSNGQPITIEPLDVSNAEAIQTFADGVIPTLQGRKLFLVNNAGVALASGSFATTPLTDFEWLLSINLWGVVRMTKAFLPYLLERNEGHIVNLSSIFGLAGAMNQSAYCTAKFGVHGFNEVLRMELLDTGVKVTSVHPGGIKTNIARNARLTGSAISEADHIKSYTTFEKVSRTHPEEAARQILDAAVKGQAKLLIGSDAKLISLIVRLFPVRYTGWFKQQVEQTFGP